MAKLSKVDAAKAAGVSRQTLYTYLKDGRISVDADGLIDTAELLRAGFALHPIGHPEPLQPGHDLTSIPHEVLDTYRDMVTLLRQQLDAALAREQRREEELAWLRQQFEQMQQRYDRLLEAPRPAPVVPVPALAHRPADNPQSMRRQILEVLQAHPEGLHHTAIAQQLGVAGDLSATLRSMFRDRLVRRVGVGVYRVAVQ